jgi:hypothetical protein
MHPFHQYPEANKKKRHQLSHSLAYRQKKHQVFSDIEKSVLFSSDVSLSTTTHHYHTPSEFHIVCSKPLGCFLRKLLMQLLYLILICTHPDVPFWVWVSLACRAVVFIIQTDTLTDLI